MLYLDNFYSSFNSPNCTVVREKLVRYTEKGVLSADRFTNKEIERDYDVIIFGTGFNVFQYLEHEEIRGVNGINLQDQWKEHPEAIYGVATSNFPNFFFVQGPNTATVWSSQQSMWEIAAHYNSMAIKKVLNKRKQGTMFAMMPDRKFEKAYNQDLQVRQAHFVWATPSCTSYYKNAAGWITFTMPWTLVQYWWKLHKITWNQWSTWEKKLHSKML